MIKEDFHCDCCIHNDDYGDVTPDGMQQLESQAIYQTLLNKALTCQPDFDDKLSLSREYIEMGYKLLLLKEFTKIPHHVHPNGFKNATGDIDEFTELLRKYPTANIGIRTGKESGITVFDFDDLDNNDRDLKEKGLRRPDSTTFTTPHGLHVLMEYQDNVPSKVNWLNKLDIKNDGGYIVAPPSMVVCDGNKHEDKIPCMDFYYDVLDTSPLCKSLEEWRIQ